MKIRLLFVVLTCLTARVDAATSGLKAGAAREDISPGTDVLNWVTGKPYGEVRDPLFVHALALDDGRSQAVLIRWDLVDVSESARDEVRKAIGASLNLSADRIMVHASHTHSAPWAPVYSGGHRGRERDSWWAIRFMPAQNDFPPFKRWMERLIVATTRAAERAVAAARPVEVSIGRIGVPEYLYNRRPRAPAWGLAEPVPKAVGYSQANWHPEVLHGGATFGPMDRTFSLVSFTGPDQQHVASLFHVACHSVSIYPSTPAISADWPGAAMQALMKEFGGGEALFLQGTAGDITPWRRGAAAVDEMAAGLAQKAKIAKKYAVKLAAAPIDAARGNVDLPLMPAARERTGTTHVSTEIQVIVCGPLALVALPGEPLTDLGTQIRERSPYPQTLVLGYSNGMGVHYVGMPGEKARGGYEAGVAGAGTDECGALMVDTAVRLLNETFARSGKKK